MPRTSQQNAGEDIVLAGGNDEQEDPPGASLRHRGPSRRFALAAIIVFALVLFAHKACRAVGNPFFYGDAAHRLNCARAPIAPLDNRIWLPFLQTNICAVYYAKLPIPAFKLIPCVYLFLAVLFLGLIAYRFTGPGYGGLLFALLAMFCFAYQRTFTHVSVDLYQEITEAALFFLLVWAGAMEFRKSKFLLLAGCAALLARDSFWIYLFSLTILNWRRIFGERRLRRSFALLWSVLVAWFLTIFAGYVIFAHRLPEIPTEWPLMINKSDNQAVTNLAISARHLWGSLLWSQAIFVGAGCAVAGLIGFLSRGSRAQDASQRESFSAVFLPFSLLSVGIIYLLIFLFDPWQVTGGSPRMMTPLVETGFIGVILLYQASARYRPAWKVLARMALVTGLVLGIDTRVKAWVPADHTKEREYHAEIRRLVDQSRTMGVPEVCFVRETYWVALRRFVAPTLRAHKLILHSPGEFGNHRCDVIIVPAKTDFRPGARYRDRGDYELERVWYKVYQKRPKSHPEQPDSSR